MGGYGYRMRITPSHSAQATSGDLYENKVHTHKKTMKTPTAVALKHNPSNTS